MFNIKFPYKNIILKHNNISDVDSTIKKHLRENTTPSFIQSQEAMIIFLISRDQRIKCCWVINNLKRNYVLDINFNKGILF